MALAPTTEDYLGIGLAAAASARNELLLDVGDVAHQDLHAAAAMADAVTEYASRLYRETFLEGNSGQALVERVTDIFKELTPKPEASAGASVTFSRATAAAGAGTIPTGTIVATATDSEGRRQEFETLADVYYGVAEVGPKSVLADARAAGSAGNVAAGAISLVVGAVFDTSLTVANTLAAAGGADAESDDEYRARARAYSRTLARGTRPAIKLGALSVPGVRTAAVSIDEIGVMTVYVADAAGGSSQQLIDAVFEELDEFWVAAGAVFSVVGGEELQVNLVIGVRLASGRAADVEGLVQKAATGELAKLSAGETVHMSAVATSVMNLNRAQFSDVRVLSPSSDVEPEPEQIPRVGTIQVVDI